ncbi:MAG: glutamyl-tRNA reductase [Ktedonobacterales bacterium]
MKLIMLGAHQRTTPIAVLEALTFSRELLPQSLEKLQGYVGSGMIISTCNRVEIYAEVDEVEPGVAALENFLSLSRGAWTSAQGSTLASYREEAVVRHIFRLAAGLDSMVLGDDQIMGQIKSAFAASREAGIAGKVLHRLVDRALAAGKIVRTHTQIASHPVSVVSVALDQAERQLGNLRSRDCLIIGAGHTADLALKLIAAKHTGKLGVINRSDDRAQRLAARYEGQAWPFDRMVQALMAHDVIVCATTAPSFLITRDLIKQSSKGTSRLFLDLSVPRGIDPVGIEAGGDHLIDIEALQAISSQNYAARAAEIVHAEALLEPEIRAFLEWRTTQAVVPTIRDLKAYAEHIRTAELQRALNRLPALSEAERQTIESLTSAIVNKLLHQPIVALKDPESGPATAKTLSQMFHLSETEKNIGD